MINGGAARLTKEEIMRTRTKLLLVTTGAALLLALAVGSTSARRLSYTNRQFRITWSILVMEDSSHTFGLICPVTLEGSFHSFTLHKVLGALIGFVTRGTAANSECGGGSMTVNQEALPWHVRYNGFSGMLPNITLLLLNLIGGKLTARVGENTCTLQSTTTTPFSGRIVVEPDRSLSEFVLDREVRIPIRGSFFCEILGQGFLEAVGPTTLLGNTTMISVRLI